MKKLSTPTAPHARKVLPPSCRRARPASLFCPADAVAVPEPGKPITVLETRGGRDSSPTQDMSLFASKRIAKTATFNLSEQYTPTPILRKPDAKTPAEWDEEFDNFFLSLTQANHIERIESFVMEQLKAHKVIYWEEVAAVQRLISKRLHVTLTHEDGLVGHAFHRRSLLIETNAMEHPKFSKEIDMNLVNPQATLIFIPLIDSSNQLEGIVEVAKKHDDPKVKPVEKEFCELLQRKFKSYSKWFLRLEDVDDIALKFSDCDDPTQFMLNFHTKMAELFGCTDSEIWHYSVAKAVMKRYKGNSVVVAEMGRLGVADVIVQKGQLVNCASNQLMSSYKPEMDGTVEEPLMGIPYTNRRHLVVIVVRGNKTDKIFAASEERLFAKLAPFIANAFLAIVIQSARNHGSGHISELKKVMPKAELKKSVTDVVDMMMNKLMKETRASRGIFYVVEGENLVSLFQNGWQQQLVVPIGKGHAGIVAYKGIVMNVPNAYESEQWDPSPDLLSDSRTTSLLTVPIFSTNGNVTAVVQLFNKNDHRPFTTTDADKCTVFGTYCSVLLDNSSLLAKWGETQRITESLCNAVLDLETRQNAEETLKMILDRAKQLLRVGSVNTFCLDFASKSLRSFVTHELLDPPPKTHSCCFEKKESFFINNTKHDAMITEKPWYTNICLVPILNGTDGECIGVFEAADKTGGFTEPDKTLMSLFAVLQGTILSEINHKRYLEKGQVQIPMEVVISERERDQFALPELLKCADIRLQTIDGPGYDTLLYSKGMDLTKLVFYVFNSFGFLEQFRISAEDLFVFLFNIEKSCSPIKFHNYIKEVDNVQFLMYLVRLGKLNDIFSSEELLIMFIAQLALYLKHDGTNDKFQIETCTPIGILHKNSPLLTNAATEIIRILEKPNCNIIKNCQDFDRIWSLLLRLIMSSSRKAMKQTVSNLEKVKNHGPIDLNNTTHRALALTLLFNASTLSHVARPLGLCQQWFGLEQEELFYLGEKLIEKKMVMKSRFTNRELYTVGLFEQTRIEKIGKPVYESLFMIFPGLATLRETIDRNLTHFSDCVKARKP